MSLFSNIELAPRDPILGLNEAFAADPRPEKINLGVGVYYDAQGRLPLLRSVRDAEASLCETPKPYPYLPIDGLPAYNHAAQELLLGKDSEVIAAGRAVTVQSVGGTGALKIGADFLHRLSPSATVAVSNPSWENHRAIFEGAGFVVNEYAYYEPEKRALNFEGMLHDLQALPAGSVIVLHACCHNPTGIDLNEDQWGILIEQIRAAKLVPFLDLAYQGFAEDLEADAKAVRLFAASGLPVFIAQSFSKTFSLYGERVGALTVIAQDAEEATRILSQLKRFIRANYSNPPTHGALLVSTVLNSPQLREIWVEELQGMRERIRGMRRGLVARIAAHGDPADYSFIVRQKGMFSYSGLSKEKVQRLRDEYAIYALDSGRLCMAALNEENIDRVAKAIAEIDKESKE